MSSSQAISPDGIANPETAVSTEARKTSKMMCVEVIFLDNSTHTFQIQSKALGQMLFEKVCKFLNLLEIDYFGLEYADEKNTKYWLDSLKPLCRQTGLSATSPTMYFCVKFYTPDPVQLEDEFTRYLFSLQIKKDLAAGLLQCNDNTAALMISYIVQAESGDYDAEECPDHCYLSSYKFVPYQDADLQRKIMENHKKHLSQTPAEADLNLLETARRCELYGIKMTSAKDHEGVPLNLAVAHMGVLVFQNFTKINTFSWAKIRKLSFKRKRFLIKLHPEGYGYYKDTVEFYFEGRNECKNFWKKCIENHTFFRCTDSKKPPRQKPRIFSRGSSFRYSGRTQKQVAEFVRENYIKRQPFQRSTSLRVADSSHTGAIGTSVSAQPLLPVSSSLSCGSMAAIAQGSSPPPMKKLSSSEPTTPHIAQDAAQMLTNGNVMQDKQKTEGNSQDVSPGLISPDFDHDQEELQSPDFLGQDTDDNISHDSYHVEEKETHKIEHAQSENKDFVTFSKLGGEPSTALLVNGQRETEEGTPNVKEISHDLNVGVGDHIEGITGKRIPYNGEIPYVLRKYHKDSQQANEHESKKKHRPRVRVEVDHQWLGQVSPTLYARANRLGSNSSDGQENGSPKIRPHTVDFVLVNQLPAIGSFSYKDDSVEIKSPEKVKLELLRQKLLESSIGTVCDQEFFTASVQKQYDSKDICAKNNNIMEKTETEIGATVISATYPESINVSESSNVDSSYQSQNVKSRELAIYDSSTLNNLMLKQAEFCNPTGNLEETSKPSIKVKSSLVEANVAVPSTSVLSKTNDSQNCLGEQYLILPDGNLSNDTPYQNYYQMVYLEVNQEDEIIDPPNQYNYSTYKFSQIGRPDESVHIRNTEQQRVLGERKFNDLSKEYSKHLT